MAHLQKQSEQAAEDGAETNSESPQTQQKHIVRLEEEGEKAAEEDSETNSESPRKQGKKHIVRSEEKGENAAEEDSETNSESPRKRKKDIVRLEEKGEKAAEEDSETNSESPHMQGKKHMVHSEEQSENMPEAADGQSNPNETPPEKLMPRVKGEEVPTGKHTVVVGDERTAQRDEVSNLEHQGVLQKIRQQLDGQTKGQQEDQQSEAPESALKPDEIVKPELDARKAKVVYETLAPMQVFKDQQDALKDSASLSQKEPRQEQKKLGGNQFGLLLGTD